MSTAKILAISAASLLATMTEAAAADFIARGNEPGWIVRKSASEITFTPMDGAPVTVSPVPNASTADGVETYQATVGDQPFTLAIASKVCVDTMSGMPFPVSVTVTTGGKTFAGCGGEPASLLHGEWTVKEINGKPVIDGSTATLNFETGGRVNGNASCNRFMAAFSLTGEGLTISNPGASKMMCEEARMAQEDLFLETLKAITHFEIASGGSLVLKSHAGASIKADRKG